MSSLENMSLHIENEKGIQDKLRWYLDNSFRKVFVADGGQENMELFLKYRDKIDIMVFDINRLFNGSDSCLKGQEYLYRFNQNILYDFSSRNILDGDKIVKLNNQEITLLEYLIKNRGNIISHETLIYIISNNSSSSIETLRTVIKRLRAKIYKSVIETISKVGYRFI
jgi:DNA-binding response OmpR family regulator